MQIRVSARHGHLNGSDQSVIEEKVGKLRRLFDKVSDILVTVDLVDLDNPKVEVVVSAEHTEDFVASAEGPTVVAALDLAIPKMEQQLRRAKEKLTGHRVPGHKHAE